MRKRITIPPSVPELWHWLLARKVYLLITIWILELKQKMCCVTSQWPWPLTSDHQIWISSSLSLRENVCQIWRNSLEVFFEISHSGEWEEHKTLHHVPGFSWLKDLQRICALLWAVCNLGVRACVCVHVCEYVCVWVCVCVCVFVREKHPIFPPNEQARLWWSWRHVLYQRLPGINAYWTPSLPLF